jgi:hypothetical protein
MAFNLDDYTSVQEIQIYFGKGILMEQYEQRLSRSQTLESLWVVNYLETQLIRNHSQQVMRKTHFRSWG